MSHGFFECVRPHTITFVHLDVADRAFAEASDAQRFFHRVMHVGCHVHHGSSDVTPSQLAGVAGGDHGDEVGYTPAGSEIARRAGRISHQLGHPPHQQVFHANRAWRGEVNP